MEVVAMRGAVTIKRRSTTHARSNATHDLPPDLHPILRRIYSARNVSSAADLDYTLDGLHPPELLIGAAEAAALLEHSLEHRRRILIIGDYDVDGATSCALAVRALRAMGGEVDYLIPNRFEYGYGLTPEIVEQAARRRPDILITVDNGITSVDGVRAARARGMKVVITDHHLPGPELPQADVIVNPNQPGDTFPSKHLAGVGVIFYVMLALRRRLRDRAWFAARGIAEPRLADLLDLVALGTVADVAMLDRNNRILVGQGLGRIRRGQCCPGILALIAVARRNRARLTAADLGFALGPRLNAAGRLQDMSLGVECLLSDTDEAAQAAARGLDELNRERRRIESEMQAQAVASLDEGWIEHAAASATSLCLYHEDWHQGVIGILASRIKDRTHRPVIAFAPAGDGEIKGSARSVPGLHIRDVLEAVALRYPGLIVRFGGHAMAAGLTLRASDLPLFKSAFEDETRRHLDPSELGGVIYSDGDLAGDEISLEVAEILQAAGPWGHGFPEPVFDGAFEIRDCKRVGDRHFKMLLARDDLLAPVEAVAFNCAEDPAAGDRRKVHIAYRLDVNEFRGRVSPQLVVEHVVPCSRSG
jgi:single-stranded-DNA-specific exonuclease